MALVVNLQRKIKLDPKQFTDFTQQLSASVDEARDGDFSVAFVSDRRMTELNSFFRDKQTTTDVLSFPHEADEFESKSYASTRETTPSAEAVATPLQTVGELLTPEGVTLAFLGDIVISVEQAQRQAKENGLTLEDEIKQLILHGLLHLCGYDHETDGGKMSKRELQLRRHLKIE